jgi:hypothetical protein
MARLFVSLSLLLCLVLTVPAEEVKVREVVAQGTGTTAREAEEDAVRAAVRQVVGAYVSVETLVKNDKLIEDKIIAASNGFVKTYKILKTHKQGGLVRVTVRAEVMQEKLVARLEQFKVTITEVDSSVHFRGRIPDSRVEDWTKEEARAQKTELLHDILLDYPKIMVARARRPDRFDYDDVKRVLAVDVHVSADLEAYHKWVKRLVARLDKINQDKLTAQCTATVTDVPFTLPKTSDRGFTLYRNADWEKTVYFPDLTKMRDSWSLWVATSVTEKGKESRWAGYVLDADLPKALRAIAGELSVKVELIDGEGARVTGEEYSLKEGSLEPNWLGTVSFRYRPKAEQYTTTTPLLKGTCSALTNDHTNTVILAPFQFTAPGFWMPSNYAAERTHPRKLMLAPAEWKKVKSIRCSVVFKPTKAGN